MPLFRLVFFGCQNEISNSLINQPDVLGVMTRSHISQKQKCGTFIEISITTGNLLLFPILVTKKSSSKVKLKEAENYEN